MDSTIHEAGASGFFSTVKKFSDTVGDIANTDKNFFKKSGTKGPYLKGSISNFTQSLIMTFPLLCDDTLSPETASMISRANERNIISMLQLLFASEQFTAKGGAEALASVYTGIKNNMSLDDYIDTFGDIADKAQSSLESTNMAEFNEQVKLIENASIQAINYGKRFPVDSFSKRSLNDYTVINFNGKYKVKEKPLKEAVLAEDIRPQDAQGMIDLKNAEIDKKVANGFITPEKGEQLKLEYQKYVMDQLNMNNQDYANFNKNTYDAQLQYNQRQLLDSDIKKANEMQPSLIIVRYNELGQVSDKEGDGIIGQRSFIAGVKSRLIPVDASDISDRINVKNKTKINFLNFIRATTGEIGFVKDFLLNLDQAKLDAKNAVKKGPAAKMWKTLEFRATRNERRKLGKAGNDASAITGLVISQETVNVIKKNYDFDLENIKNAISIMDAYNLLSLIIADESREVVKFLYAGNDAFEMQAYSFLEREDNDKSYKKVINLISQSNGGR